MCGKSFIMEEYQSNPEIQIQTLKGEVGHFKVNNAWLQYEIEKGNYFNGLT